MLAMAGPVSTKLGTAIASALARGVCGTRKSVGGIYVWWPSSPQLDRSELRMMETAEDARVSSRLEAEKGSCERGRNQFRMLDCGPRNTRATGVAAKSKRGIYFPVTD